MSGKRTCGWDINPKNPGVRLCQNYPGRHRYCLLHDPLREEERREWRKKISRSVKLWHARRKHQNRLEVWPNPDGGFYVVEVGYKDSLGNSYDMPRGWTYPTREMAQSMIPLVEAGIYYPTLDQIAELVEAKR